MAASALLGSLPRVFIRQQKEWTEILVDWETRNQYAVLDEGGRAIGTIAERSGGALDFLRRLVLRSHRPFEVAVVDGGGSPVLKLSRGFFFLFSDLRIEDGASRLVGEVKRRFGVIYKKYDLHDGHGRVFARVSSPRWRLWTFPVKGEDGVRTAVVSKKWGGGLREIFSDADTFLVDFENGAWSDDERAVILAAAVSIDFDFFENNAGRGGLVDLIPGGN